MGIEEATYTHMDTINTDQSSNTEKVVNLCLAWTCEQLGIAKDRLPVIKYAGPEFSLQTHSFGRTKGNEITVVIKGRQPMDVCRTLIHELIHFAKNHQDGSDGSEDENEANALTGELMRKFQTEHADFFGLQAEATMFYRQRLQKLESLGRWRR